MLRQASFFLDFVVVYDGARKTATQVQQQSVDSLWVSLFTYGVAELGLSHNVTLSSPALQRGYILTSQQAVAKLSN